VLARFDLCTTIYSATREHRGPGEHYCEGLIFKRLASSAEASAAAEASAIVAEALDIVEQEGNGHEHRTAPEQRSTP
jgi:hypothetical protein